ncbi:phage integrase SAM-like domain-containing protein [Sphingobacterium olei]|uniref:phage integrase SAM-like domain-containing protein n=1 Tax=Sphingobacterium olei TaxID=2571155 RepID=UPI00138FEA41
MRKIHECLPQKEVRKGKDTDSHIPEPQQKSKISYWFRVFCSTLERYEVSLKHTQEFLQDRYGIQDIALHKINYTFVADYDFYLRTDRIHSSTTNLNSLRSSRFLRRLIKKLLYPPTHNIAPVTSPIAIFSTHAP